MEEIAEIYANGVHSVKSDGSVLTIGGFAVGEGKKHGVDTYYGTPTPLDDFVSAALNGTGVWAGESDAVRKQGVQKEQEPNHDAWVVHELNAALEKAADGNDGKGLHNWDEAWAFYLVQPRLDLLQPPISEPKTSELSGQMVKRLRLTKDF